MVNCRQDMLLNAKLVIRRSHGLMPHCKQAGCTVPGDGRADHPAGQAGEQGNLLPECQKAAAVSPVGSQLCYQNHRQHGALRTFQPVPPGHLLVHVEWQNTSAFTGIERTSLHVPKKTHCAFRQSTVIFMKPRFCAFAASPLAAVVIERN